MIVDPVYASIGNVFKQKPLFRVPKYQRSYAWDKQEIDDFLNDIEKCFNKRKNSIPSNHFFGGIVSVEKAVPNTLNQKEYELVDGQQRTATFVMLAGSMIELYKILLEEAQSNSDIQNSTIIEKRINTLKEQFIEFEQEKNRRTESVDVLLLSKADEIVFGNIIKQLPIFKTRDSHEKIEQAYKKIFIKVKELVGSGNITDRMDNLELFHNVIDADLSVIHIKTHDKDEAYVLFRVLNDRGKNLSDGDLLRARILEMVEEHPSFQRSIENLWDQILSDPPSITEDYLKVIYTSKKGVRPGANTLFNDFLDAFYPQHTTTSLNSTEASLVQKITQDLAEDIILCRKLYKGEWPYTSISLPLTKWDVNRLTLLIRDLGLTITLPILLAATKLDAKKFSNIIQILERFLFRYKIIGNQHIGSASSIMLRETLSIRNNLNTYNTLDLERALHALQLTKVSDYNFELLISQLEYKVGGGNSTLKYLLITIEHYLRWYKNGAVGAPKCEDKTRIYDFTSTTLEHIYPRNADTSNIDNSLEPVKNNLGNITIMGPTDNVAGANNTYVIKRPIFQMSSVKMNNEIGLNNVWTINEVNTRIIELKSIALKIFNV